MFSPASSSISSRILPTVFLQHKADDWVLMSCDMQDAFLTVQQRELTVGNQQAYALGRVLPGERAGSLFWNEDITNHLKETLDMVECTIYPSMLKNKDNKLFILLHVADFLVTEHGHFPKRYSKQKRINVTFECRWHVLHFLLVAPPTKCSSTARQCKVRARF